MKQPTRKQLIILLQIRRLSTVQKHPVVIRDIASVQGKSHGTIYSHINLLVRKGYVKWAKPGCADSMPHIKMTDAGLSAVKDLRYSINSTGCITEIYRGVKLT